MVGLVTLVIMRVDSVTSTSLRSSLGDMRTYSAPMVPVSSGALPGQRSTTRGLSAAVAAVARQRAVRRGTGDATRMGDTPLGRQTGPDRPVHGVMTRARHLAHRSNQISRLAQCRDGLRQTLPLQRGQILFDCQRWVLQTRPLLLGSRADQVWSQVEQVHDKLVRMLGSIPYLASVSLGKSFRFDVTITSAPARIAAATTWRWPGSGRLIALIRSS